MHQSFPFQCIFSASLRAFQKGVHCTKALHPLTRAVRAVQCAVRFSTLHRLPHTSTGMLHMGGAPCAVPALCKKWAVLDPFSPMAKVTQTIVHSDSYSVQTLR